MEAVNRIENAEILKTIKEVFATRTPSEKPKRQDDLRTVGDIPDDVYVSKTRMSVNWYNDFNRFTEIVQLDIPSVTRQNISKYAPVGYTFKGKQRIVKSWSDLRLLFCHDIISDYTDVFNELLNAGENLLVYSDTNTLTRPGEPYPGMFIELNRPPYVQVQRISQMLKLCGLTDNDIQIDCILK